jgi:hypothetical protein
MKLAARALRVAPALLAVALPFFLIDARTNRAFADDDDDDAPATRSDGSKVEKAFTRFQKNRNGGTLETAYAVYKNKDTDVEVILYGAVHIADKAYYKKVQKDLDSYDVVLYEGVSPSKDQEPDENMKSIGELQTTMGSMLGLTFQKDGINYKAKNLVHADMTYDELLKATDGDISKALPGAQMFSDPQTKSMLKPMLKMMKSFGKQFMEMAPQMRDGLKLQMAQQLAGTDLSKVPGGEGAAKILVGERNKVALKVLDEQLAKRKSGKIAIFYGAAHMKDFNDRLEAKGWKQTKVEWNVAWDVGGKNADAEGDSDDDDAPKAPAPERRREHEKSGARWF